jgi:serine/threonine protein kinase/TolB-like protein
LQPGTLLNNYEILAPLGAGGMGEVYRARDNKLRREVALKVLRAELAEDEERLARFEREALLLAQLNHPNIATLFELGDADKVRFLVMELVPGQTLAGRLQAGPLTIREGLALARQIAEALDSAHARGVIHRDLKPSNIKVTPEGRVKVLDFGLAKALDSESQVAEDQFQTASMTGLPPHKKALLGTPAYMSPEQIEHKPLDQRTDIWSFGCVLYETLSGRQPYVGETVINTLAAIIGREPEWTVMPGDVPARFYSLIQRCLAKKRDQRPRDMSVIRQELEQVAREMAMGGDSDALAQLARTGPQTPVLRPGQNESRTEPIGSLGSATTRTFAPLPRAPKRGMGLGWILGIVLLLGLTAAGLYLFADRLKPIETVAVLPFVAPDSDPALVPFAQRFAQRITDHLGGGKLQISTQEKVARVTDLSSLTPRQAAKRLSVRGIVSGRILFEANGNVVTIHAELIDTWTGRTLWEQKFSRKNDFPDEMASAVWQDQVARDIAERVRHRLTGASDPTMSDIPTSGKDDAVSP